MISVVTRQASDISVRTSGNSRMQAKSIGLERCFARSCHGQSKLSSRLMINMLVLTSLVAIVSAGENCVTDFKCKNDYGEMYVCEDSRCIRKHYSYSVREISGFFFSMFVSIISSTGGVGAGTMIVPTYMFFLQFNSGDSVHLSRFSLFGGSLVYFILNWKRRDPKFPDRLMINYNIASMMVPLHIAGAEFGVIIGKYLPMLIVSILLILLLYTSLYKTYERAHQESQNEHIQAVKNEIENNRYGPSIASKPESTQEQTASQGSQATTDINNTLSASNLGQENDVPSSRSGDEEEENHPGTDTVMDMEAKTSSKERGVRERVSSLELNLYASNFPTMRVSELVKEHHGNFLIFIVASAVNIISTMVRGGEGRQSILGLEPCSESTWKVLFTSQVSCLFLAFVGYTRNYSKMESESRETMTMLKDRVIRNKLIVASYVTGLAAGMAGVGGGMVLSIYMLSLGVDVGTAGSLSMFAVLFSASSTCIQSIMVGGIHLRHAYAIIAVAFVGSLIGTVGLRKLLLMLNKPSFILWVLVGVLSIAGVVLPIQTITAIFNHPQVTFSVGNFC
jgi:uncharacterized membrane protein YfcA